MPGLGGIPACTEADPPVNRMTDRCKNITLPQTAFAGSKNESESDTTRSLKLNALPAMVVMING